MDRGQRGMNPVTMTIKKTMDCVEKIYSKVWLLETINKLSTQLFIIEWRFTPLITVFQSYHSDGSHYYCLLGFLGFTSITLELCSVLSKDIPSKKSQRIQSDSNSGPSITSQNILPEPRGTPRSFSY